jgi:hypothetical protein
VPLQDCVNKTIARIKQKLEREDKRVLNHVIYTMRSSDKLVQQAVSRLRPTLSVAAAAAVTLHAMHVMRSMMQLVRFVIGLCMFDQKVLQIALTFCQHDVTNMMLRNVCLCCACASYLASVVTCLQVAISLAQLAPTGELKQIFVDKAGLDILLDLLTDRAATASECCWFTLQAAVPRVLWLGWGLG